MRTTHCCFLMATTALTMQVAVAATTYTVTNTAPAGNGSLANAITLANANLDTSTIRFSIAGDCPRVITLSDTLSIPTNVLIDGYTQLGSIENSSETQWNGKICVVFDGNGLVGTGIATHASINCDVSGYGHDEFFLASRDVVVSQTFGCTTS